MIHRWGHVSKVYAYVQLILAFEQEHGHRPTNTASDLAAMDAVVKHTLKHHHMPDDFITDAEIAVICAQVRHTVAVASASAALCTMVGCARSYFEARATCTCDVG